MNSLLALAGAVAVGVFVGLVVSDLKSLTRRACRRLMVFAARPLPEPQRKRFSEEWVANIDAVSDAPLSALVLTMFTVARSRFWAREFQRSIGSQHENEPRSATQQLSELLPSFPFVGNPKLTFEQFAVGDCNRLAHAAALAVAEMPARTYNPLFICGPPGVGKTHLLYAIQYALRSTNPSLMICATTGEGFCNEFLAALSNGKTEGFKARLRGVDVLLLDDVQFLERKARTEEEFLYTFDALFDSGRQIVLTSDRPPHDLQALEERLRERFQVGLVADIDTPDLPTRMAILHKRAAHDRIELSEEAALNVIADRVRTNVRALEGALIRVVAFSSLTGRPLTAALAEEVVTQLYPQHPADESKADVS
jgi:chromosomal replication initiator protein DnaA